MEVGDDRYTYEVQQELLALTAAYHNAQTKQQRDDIRAEADALRISANEKVNNGSTTVSSADKDMLDIITSAYNDTIGNGPNRYIDKDDYALLMNNVGVAVEISENNIPSQSVKNGYVENSSFSAMTALKDSATIVTVYSSVEHKGI